MRAAARPPALLAGRLPQARIIAIDLSAALLTTTRSRLPAAARAGAVRADFHRLPLAGRSLRPGRRRVLPLPLAIPGQRHRRDRPLPGPGRDGDHRREVGRQLPGTRPADGRLRPGPRRGRPPEPVPDRPQRQHRATRRRQPRRPPGRPRNPRIHLPGARRLGRVPGHLTQVRAAAALTSDPAALADELRRRLPDQPFTTTSVVTYLVARRTTAAP